MSLFKQRKRANEAKFAQDGEFEFQSRVRAFRHLAAWASSIKGDSEEQERDFAQTLIRENVRHSGDDKAVSLTLEYLGNLADEKTVRAKLVEFGREARDWLRFEQVS